MTTLRRVCNLEHTARAKTVIITITKKARGTIDVTFGNSTKNYLRKVKNRNAPDYNARALSHI